jgi:asparagine synthase (glutamine-hydrolysing)
MDSTWIVCMSDHLKTNKGAARGELVDTISYFDNGEPNWDEMPYVSIVESRRDKSGVHVDLSASVNAFSLDFEGKATDSLWPEDCRSVPLEPMNERDHRVVISGLGGDELLGGVPTPLPELADLLYRHRYVQLIARSFAWCKSDRKALILRLRDVAKFRWSVYRKEAVPSSDPQWLTERTLAALALTAEEEDECDLWRDLSPSAISFLKKWRQLLETLPTHGRGDRLKVGYCFPFLDRDLVDFLSRVPREQLVRPGRRRSLMRRALKGVVPEEVIERRRKAFVVRRPVATMRDHYSEIRRFFEDSIAAERGYIDRARILRAFDEFQASTNISRHRLLARAINLETWLRSLNGMD